ncbi:hypothetical protein BJY01DRAFT_149174 [Aspergillus pseudoustus]|uniref:Uncharacterized protein n=1 Tax=Aspergillus pseudoustus TaxID=1810923 RepID=A0ABR4KA61_9EURO
MEPARKTGKQVTGSRCDIMVQSSASAKVRAPTTVPSAMMLDWSLFSSTVASCALSDRPFGGLVVALLISSLPPVVTSGLGGSPRPTFLLSVARSSLARALVFPFCWHFTSLLRNAPQPTKQSKPPLQTGKSHCDLPLISFLPPPLPLLAPLVRATTIDIVRAALFLRLCLLLLSFSYRSPMPPSLCAFLLMSP